MSKTKFHKYIYDFWEFYHFALKCNRNMVSSSNQFDFKELYVNRTEIKKKYPNFTMYKMINETREVIKRDTFATAFFQLN